MSNEVKINDLRIIREVAEYFKPKVFNNQDIQSFEFSDIEYLKKITTPEFALEFRSDITDDLTTLLFINENVELYEDKISLYDSLIFKYLYLKVIYKDINLYTIVGILNNNKEPNYNILSKVYHGSEVEKIKVENILDLLYGKSANEPFKVIMLTEYLIQRSVIVKQFIIGLIKSSIILWCKKYEPKTQYWIKNYFNSSLSMEDQWENIELFTQES